MITDVDIEKLKQVFPTRDELKGFATKDDLNDMRNDLNDMRNDLTRFATKDDLKEMEQRMTKTIRSSNLSNVNREVNFAPFQTETHLREVRNMAVQDDPVVFEYEYSSFTFSVRYILISD